MCLVAQVGWIDPVGKLCHPGHQLGRDLYVVSLDLIQGPDPESRLHFEQGELLLGEGADDAGDEGALGEAAVQLGQELRVGLANVRGGRGGQLILVTARGCYAPSLSVCVGCQAISRRFQPSSGTFITALASIIIFKHFLFQIVGVNVSHIRNWSVSISEPINLQNKN